MNISELITNLFDRYLEISKTKKEIDAATEIGREISSAMSGCKWLKLTKFPSMFYDIKSESSLYDSITAFNWWINEIGMSSKFGLVKSSKLRKVESVQTEDLDFDMYIKALAQESRTKGNT